jgi:GNAT superfamily N-acetyltransferase
MAAARIVAYDARRHRGAFSAVNREWIERYFKMEAHDFELLDDPATHVLGGEARGEIFIAEAEGDATSALAAAAAALAEGEDNALVLGACALVWLPRGRATPEPSMELIKMGVRARAQGRGVGRRLGEAAMARAWELGAASVHIWSNTVLGPAIALYKSLGFVEVPMGDGEVFERANIRLLALRPGGTDGGGGSGGDRRDGRAAAGGAASAP